MRMNTKQGEGKTVKYGWLTTRTLMSLGIALLLLTVPVGAQEETPKSESSG